MGLCLWPEVTNWALIWTRGHNKTEAAELELKGQHVYVAVQYCRGNYSGWVYPSTSQHFLLLLDMRVFLIFIFYKYCVGAPSNLQISTYTRFLFLFYKNPKIIYDSKMIRWVTSTQRQWHPFVIEPFCCWHFPAFETCFPPDHSVF